MPFSGDKLKRLREAKGLSLTDVEALTGLKPGHISDIENGKRNPRPDSVRKLSEGLKIEEEYFYTDNSRLPTDLLPELPSDVVKMIMAEDSAPYLVLAEKAKTKGVSPETLAKLIEVLTSPDK